MAANAVDFAGTLCGCRYEKELETHFRDCLLFYIDGRIRLDRGIAFFDVNIGTALLR